MVESLGGQDQAAECLVGKLQLGAREEARFTLGALRMARHNG